MIKAIDPLAPPRLVLLTEGQLDVLRAKTAVAMLRYRARDIACVLDSTRAGEDLASIVGVGTGVPIVSSIDEALSYRPTGLLIGIAPAGGVIPAEWRNLLVTCLTAGLDVISGLHEFVGDDPALRDAATRTGARLVDLRRPPEHATIGCARALQHPGLRVLTVGTDECIGKMTAALELTQGAIKRGWDAQFIATGQTGIAVAGSGVALDAVVADFLAGAVETLILNSIDRQLIVVEGQGAITSPSFSGVTVGLLHGCLPQALVLCHDSSRTHSRGTTFKLPSPRAAMELYEKVAQALAPCRTVGICVNTAALEKSEAEGLLLDLEAELGVPATDPIRFGTENILNSISTLLRF